MSKFTFLGTANAFGHGGRRRSHYLWEGTEKWLIDASYDALSGLRSLDYIVGDLDKIFISHLHPDHYMALPQFALENKYALKSDKTIDVYGPIEVEETIVSATSFFFDENVQEHIHDLFNFIEVGENEYREFPGGSLETLPAEHSGNARMQIITMEDKSVGYTGDTAYVEDSFRQLLDCDITITEASSASHPIPKHTTLDELLAKEFDDDKRIYISHIGHDVLDREDDINPPYYLANDGMEIII